MGCADVRDILPPTSWISTPASLKQLESSPFRVCLLKYWSVRARLSPSTFRSAFSNVSILQPILFATVCSTRVDGEEGEAVLLSDILNRLRKRGQLDDATGRVARPSHTMDATRVSRIWKPHLLCMLGVMVSTMVVSIVFALENRN